jgi:competence protein ComEA
MKKILLSLIAFFAFSSFAFAAVDLNTATVDELQSVKGIGEKKAQAIVEYRQANGPFKSVNDLQNVKGFGEKSVKKLKKDLTVGGAAAPAEKKEEKKAEKKMSKAEKKAAKKAEKEAKAKKAAAEPKKTKEEMKAEKPDAARK